MTVSVHARNPVRDRGVRVPGRLFRGMGVLYLRLKPDSSRESLARDLRDHLRTLGVRYHMRSLKRQLSGDVSTVPASVQQAMHDLLLRDTSLQTAADVEFALWTAGLAVVTDRRRSAYVSTERILPLTQLWLMFNPTRSRRSLAVTLSQRLAGNGIDLKIDVLQVVLAGRQPTARREILEALLGLLTDHGIESESDAVARCTARSQDIAQYAAARRLEPVDRFASLVLTWKVHTRAPSMRRLAFRLKERLSARGLELSVARIQTALAGKTKTVRAALVLEMETLLRTVLPAGTDLSAAVAEAVADRTRLDDLRWVDARRVSGLAEQWLSTNPASSMRQLAIRVAETARRLGYSTSSNTIQPILGGHKKRARGFVYRAMLEQLPDCRPDRLEPALAERLAPRCRPLRASQVVALQNYIDKQETLD